MKEGRLLVYAEGREKGKARVNGKIGRKGKHKRRFNEEMLKHLFLKVGTWDTENTSGTGRLTPRIERTLGSRLERRLGIFGGREKVWI